MAVKLQPSSAPAPDTSQPAAGAIPPDPMIGDLVRHMEAKCGAGAALTLDDDEVLCHVTGWIGTRSVAVDGAIGKPGIPLGRITEIMGGEGCGKSSLLDHVLGECQRVGGVSALADTEEARDLAYSQRIGVVVPKLIVLPARTIEEVFTKVEEFVTGAKMIFERQRVAWEVACKEAKKKKAPAPPEPQTRPIVIGWDSVGGTPTAAEMKDGAGDAHMATAAKVIKQNLRRLVQFIAEERIGLVAVNQVYSKLGGYGGEVAYGGGGFPYHATLRLQLAHRGLVWWTKKDQEEHRSPVGQICSVKTIKNKMAPPMRYRKFVIVYGVGVDNTWNFFEDFRDSGLIETKGGWSKFSETLAEAAGGVLPDNSFQGWPELREMCADRKVYEALERVYRAQEASRT